MINSTKTEDRLVLTKSSEAPSLEGGVSLTNCLSDNYQQHPNLLSVRMLKWKLKAEKLKDKTVYQSLKQKMTVS